MIRGAVCFARFSCLLSNIDGTEFDDIPLSLANKRGSIDGIFSLAENWGQLQSDEDREYYCVGGGQCR